MSNEHPEPGDPRLDDDLDPAIAAVLWRAYSHDVGVDTAARHLWRIHRAANPTAVPSGRGTRRALVAALTGLMLLMSTGGALAASVSTVPGDALYSVKRTVERTRLMLAMSPETDARLHLAMARQRLTEADRAVVKRPAVVPRLIEDAAASVEHAERSGNPEVAQEALVVREEVSQKAVALAVTLEDPASKDLLVAVSERLMASTPDDEADAADEAALRSVPEPPDVAVPAAVVEDELEPAEPPVETAMSTPGTTPEPTPPVVAAPTPRPPPTSEPTPAPGDETDEEPAEEESTDGDLPPADPRGSPGVGKETQELKPEPEPESAESE